MIFINEKRDVYDIGPYNNQIRDGMTTTHVDIDVANILQVMALNQVCNGCAYRNYGGCYKYCDESLSTKLYVLELSGAVED